MKKLSLLLTIIILTTTFYTCSIDTTQEEATPNSNNPNNTSNILESTHTNGTWKDYVIKNINNPYDSAGYYHNMIFRCFFSVY